MANKVYIHAEPAVKFRPSGAGGAGNNLDITSLANQDGQYSARIDLGSGARSGVYEWRGQTKLGGTGIVGQALELYLSTSDGTLADGGLSGTTTGDFSSSEKRRNLQYLGSIIVDDSGTNPTLYSSGLVNIYSRYIYIVVWNNAGAALSSTDADHIIYLTPVPSELQ